MDDAGMATRINAMLSGVWLVAFGLWIFVFSKKRAGPPLPFAADSGATWLGKFATFGLVTSFTTLKRMRKLPQLGLFLISYFIFSDGISTLAGSASVFAQEELNMSQVQIILAIIEMSFLAVLSCAIFFWIQVRFHVAPKYILIFNLCCLGFLPVYGLISLKAQWEFFLLAAIYGLSTGSQMAYTRSMFSAAVPRGHESEFFAFYELTDKGTAWAGPLVVASVFTATGSFRKAFGCLVAFMVLGAFVLLFFDPDKADAQRKIFELQEERMEQHQSRRFSSATVGKPAGSKGGGSMTVVPESPF